MKFKKNYYRILCVFSFLFCSPFIVLSQGLQDNDLQAKYREARTFFESKDYKNAAAAYSKLYSKNVENNETYQEYLVSLIALKDYKSAEKLAKNQIQNFGKNPIYLISLGNVFKLENKEKLADEQFTSALSYLNGDDILTQQIVSAFSANQNDEWTIKTYERAIQVTQNPNLYSSQLARLYSKSGAIEKAINITIESSQNMPQLRGDESIESSLLEIIGKDADKQKAAQKAIIRLVNAQPENYLYTYLLTWIFSIQDNWDQAILQVQALERRNTDKGKLLIDFAMSAAQQQQFEIAAKAYNTVVSYGNMHPRYRLAKEGLLKMRLMKIQSNIFNSKEDLKSLSNEYAAFALEYPDVFGHPIINDYAMFEAQIVGNTSLAIQLLEKAISLKMGNKDFTANCKLQLGDYYIIIGKVWDAALMYAQVDKAFREDALGEEARFRNAKLSYYQNDFEQAQGQLSVLKASTSELIANDALFLSVLITENIPTDSNLVALQRFAYADLLLFQNKDEAAEQLLDSIATAFPKNPLADNILLLRSKIASKHKNFPKSIEYLKLIIEKHGKDVLADDAMFSIAEIYTKYLKKPEEGKKYYEQLFIDYPGSSFINESRKALKALNNSN